MVLRVKRETDPVIPLETSIEFAMLTFLEANLLEFTRWAAKNKFMGKKEVAI
jgi:hypothetical protein